MNTETMEDRRAFLRRAGRTGLFLALGATGAVLLRRSQAACIRLGPCEGCRLFEGCELRSVFDKKSNRNLLEPQMNTDGHG